MIRTITATAIVALTAGGATAQGLNYARLSYDYNDFDTNDVDFGLFQGEIEYSINQFVLGANVRNFDLNGDVIDSNFTTYNVWGGYTISPQALVGIGLGAIWCCCPH